MQKADIEIVLKEHTAELMDIPGVTGIGIGLENDRPCIKVFVDSISQENRQKIPESIQSFPLVIEYTGRFSAR